MAELPFSIDLIRALAENRTALLTEVSLFFTFLGEIEGYVFLISLLYVTYDKKLAFRLAVLALFAIRYADRISTLWRKFSYGQQVAIVTASSVILWFATRELSAWAGDGHPYTFLSYMGLLTGIVIAHPLEARMLDFDPRSSSLPRKALRCALSVGMVIGTLLVLDAAFGALSDDASLLGGLLRFVRYAAAGIVGMFIAPLVFVKMGLAARLAK